jgi:PAS domain S-box-containing protein
MLMLRDRGLLLWTILSLVQLIGFAFIGIYAFSSTGALPNSVIAVSSAVLVACSITNLILAKRNTQAQQSHLEKMGAIPETRDRKFAPEMVSKPDEEQDPLALSVSRALSKGSRQARAYIDNMPVGLLTLDMGGTIQLANLRALKIFHASVDKIVGRPIIELIQTTATDSAPSFERMKELMLGTLTETLALRPDGQMVPVDVAMADYSGFGGTGYIINFSDLTERYEVERLKEEFVSMVSHDLRSPLSAIALFLSMLATKEAGQAISENDKVASNVANEEANRLIRLVNSLLDMTMIRSGKLDLNIKLFNAKELLERVAAGMEYSCKWKNIAILVEGEEVDVSADEDRIYQVVENLIGNAIKFSQRNSTIRLGIEMGENVAVITVADSGAGIPKEFQSKIFDRFQQVSESDRSVHGGKGLGLAICKMIVEQHGGKIGVSSEEGQGSKFWFTLNL